MGVRPAAKCGPSGGNFQHGCQTCYQRWAKSGPVSGMWVKGRAKGLVKGRAKGRATWATLRQQSPTHCATSPLRHVPTAPRSHCAHVPTAPTCPLLLDPLNFYMPFTQLDKEPNKDRTILPRSCGKGHDTRPVASGLLPCCRPESSSRP